MTYTSHTAKYIQALIISVFFLAITHTYVSAQEVPVNDVPVEEITQLPPVEPTTPNTEEIPEALPPVNESTEPLEEVTEVPEDIGVSQEETMCILPKDTETAPLNLPLAEADPQDVQCVLPEVPSIPETLDTASSTDSLPEIGSETEKIVSEPTEIPEELEMYPDRMPFGPDGESGIGRCIRGNWEIEGFDSMGECVREVRG